MSALFEVVDDGLYLPTERARGPWSPEALHGGPTAALLAGAVESVESDGPMHLSRLTVELLRPVPISQLRVDVSLLRPGRKVQLVGASVFAGEVEVARAVGLRIRAADVGLPELPAGAAGGVAPEMAVGRSQARRSGEWTAFHNTGVEMRYTQGYMDDPGPVTVWMRLTQPVVAGTEPTPAQRVAAVADFGNGVSSWLDWEKFSFINPDLTIHFARPAVGEWICLQASTVISAPEVGVGMAESALFDTAGRVGRSLQSLLVDVR